MTEEQIKQNAEAYADKAAPITEQNKGIPLAIHTAAEVAYIAGAHSRDEEIEELQNELESLRKGFYERGDKLKELMLANNKLRNPWIRVEDRLPDDMQKVIWVRKDGQYFFGHFHNHDNGRLYFVSTEAVTDVTGEWRDRVTHWMPIPKLQKGE